MASESSLAPLTVRSSGRALLALAALALSGPVQAGPVLCTTSLEAPPVAAAGSYRGYAAPVEITRCGPVQAPPELVERRFYSFTAPFAPGVNLLHQFTDALGLAVPGRDGGRIVAFGFPDQTTVWDGTAMGNTAARLLEDQSQPMPLRTADLAPVFTTSVGSGTTGVGRGGYVAPRLTNGWVTPVRGLW
jgi:hypothetical protein